MKKAAILILLTAIVVGIAYGYCRSRPSRQDVVTKVFGGQEIFDAFLGCRAATAQRLHLDPGQVPGELSHYIHDAPVPVPLERIRELQGLLQKPGSYYWGPEGKACMVDYGVLLNFSSGQRVLRVALCFNCSELGLFAGEGSNASRINTESDFDPSRKQLAR